MKSPLVELTEAILHQLPPSSRFDGDDAALVLCHQPLLLALENDLVQGFYDTLYAHEPLRAVMASDDRLAREATLRQWWQRTVTGPFDEHYWTWQVLVGLVHIKRGVKNPMMMGMWGFLLTWLRGQLAASVGESEATRVMGGFERLAVGGHRAGVDKRKLFGKLSEGVATDDGIQARPDGTDGAFGD